MKKFLLCGFFVVLTIFLSACNKEKISEKIDTSLQVQSSGSVDIDLSAMNYTMLSSIVFDVMISPEKYANKRIKISGNYYTSIYEGTRYFSVLNWDATGCCPAGFDFIPMPAMNFPEDFPEPDEKITVIGTMQYADEAKDSLLFHAEEILSEL